MVDLKEHYPGKAMVKFFISLSLASVVFIGADLVFAQESAPLLRGLLTDVTEVPATTQVIDMVVASIDGEPLTVTDLKNYIREKGDTPPEDVTDGSLEVRQYLRDFVVSRLLQREADERGMNIGDGEVDAYIEEIKRQNRVDDAGFSEILAKQGMTMAQYRQAVKSDIIRARIIGTTIRANVNVVDEDVERYVKEHPEIAPEQGSVHLEQVIFTLPDDLDDEQVARQVKAMRDKLSGERNWSEQQDPGARYSDLGHVAEEELREELRDAVSGLEEGEISEVVRTDLGFHVLRLISRAGETRELDPSVKEKIRKEIYDSRVQEKLARYLNDELPKKYHVEIKL